MISYGSWIVQVGFVEFLYVRGVSAEEIGIISLILHHDAHLSSGFPNKNCGYNHPLHGCTVSRIDLCKYWYYDSNLTRMTIDT